MHIPPKIRQHSKNNQGGSPFWCGALVLKVCEIRSESLIRFVAIKFAIPSNRLEDVRSNPLVKSGTLFCANRGVTSPKITLSPP